jgi:hypothetical protein
MPAGPETHELAHIPHIRPAVVISTFQGGDIDQQVTRRRFTGKRRKSHGRIVAAAKRRERETPDPARKKEIPPQRTQSTQRKKE